MFESYFHFDVYRLAAEIADEYELNQDQVLSEIEDYLGYDAISDRDLAIPVWFEILVEEYETHSIAFYIYSILITYFDDEPTGKVYIDF